MKNYLLGILVLRKNFPKEENELIKKAYDFAKEKHLGQKFDGSKYSYFVHPAFAGYLLAKWGRNYEEICAGILHDVVEDCEVSLETIRKMFGKRTAFLVDGMSWERKWNEKDKKYLKDRPGFYRKIMGYSLQDIGIVIVHASDELSKLSDIFHRKFKKKDEDREKTAKRLLWAAKIMIPFYKEIGLKKLSDKVWEKLKDYIGEKPKSDLDNYISKEGLKKIRDKLKRIKGIDELKW